MNQKYLDILAKTFDTNTRKNYLPLWIYIDKIIDDGAKCIGILCGTECVYESIEDFCKENNIMEIPELYKYIFNARHGFLTQAKMSNYIRNEWNARFPERLPQIPIDPNDVILRKYKDFLENKKEIYALESLNIYLYGEVESD